MSLSSNNNDQLELDEPRVVMVKRSNGLGAFAVGLALGAGLALLLAPSSGEVLRRRIRREARRARRAAQYAAGDLVDNAAEVFDNTKARMEDTIDTVRNVMTDRLSEMPRRHARADR